MKNKLKSFYKDKFILFSTDVAKKHFPEKKKVIENFRREEELMALIRIVIIAINIKITVINNKIGWCINF